MRATMTSRTLLRVLLVMVVTLGTALSYQDASPSGAEMACWAENHSYPTTCAEEDNVNVPIFCPEVSRFWVVATHPRYCPCVYDGCPADFSGCPPGSGDGGTETCSKLWDDGINVVEACTISNWWRPYSMSCVVRSQSMSCHYLRLYRKIEGAASWPQFLVLYEDGNMRLKPHPPEGISDVCFGSSVIIGPAPLDPSPKPRPYVDIQEVRVNPAALSLDITYRNGGTAHIDLFVDRAQAVAEVEISYSTSAEIPFATFRSMWVADGKADVDHIRVSTGSFPILTGWTNLEGLWWLFHREVDSTHNRSAPDIQITVDTPAVFRVEQTGYVFAEGAYHCGLPSGCFNAGMGADIAERINVSEPATPGDVVELDPDHPGMYRKTRSSYSLLVAGVISSVPAITLDSRKLGDDRPLLALMGVVPVKASAENGAIRPGDLLTTSSTPGYAMRCADLKKCEGAIVGKALEPLAEGTGTIRMLVMR